MNMCHICYKIHSSVWRILTIILCLWILIPVKLTIWWAVNNHNRMKLDRMLESRGFHTLTLDIVLERSEYINSHLKLYFAENLYKVFHKSQQVKVLYLCYDMFYILGLGLWRIYGMYINSILFYSCNNANGIDYRKEFPVELLKTTFLLQIFKSCVVNVLLR
jgi:hypothetical protein